MAASANPEMMAVRIQGGDVVRRPVAFVRSIKNFAGEVIATVSEPKTEDDELAVWLIGDPLPHIFKV